MNNKTMKTITAESLKAVARQLLSSEWQEGEIETFSVPCYAKKRKDIVLFIFDAPVLYNGENYTRFAVGAKIGELMGYVNINW